MRCHYISQNYNRPGGIQVRIIGSDCVTRLPDLLVSFTVDCSYNLAN